MPDFPTDEVLFALFDTQSKEKMKRHLEADAENDWCFGYEEAVRISHNKDGWYWEWDNPEDEITIRRSDTFTTVEQVVTDLALFAMRDKLVAHDNRFAWHRDNLDRLNMQVFDTTDPDALDDEA